LLLPLIWVSAILGGWWILLTPLLAQDVLSGDCGLGPL